MVLLAMVEMRAGKGPTAAEKALAAEARERFARLCEEVRPKDLFSSEAVRVMVKDLGLNRSRDPVLAFRPKMSIADRVQQTKKKCIVTVRSSMTVDEAQAERSLNRRTRERVMWPLSNNGNLEDFWIQTGL
ncbi:hypothetical protein MA16_Dca027290 [Dendrobium catenatum]|uniref:DUF7797 domain-containing protein n=1 Tax=Dendrobium catenatum TaxID=906689 RepID=A0A2I0VFH3_9ASPA|nr:hypothetical protein MA16_Dca027290 [Dendrobium catenatum]